MCTSKLSPAFLRRARAKLAQIEQSIENIKIARALCAAEGNPFPDSDVELLQSLEYDQVWLKAELALY